ncbi:MacB family efflux pump subunit [Bibersteinia trehalosi]|uniref:Pyoverdine export ATP-binding/permease protein PvdT n=1 Tax=Bibersteinia trehalosi USDA-ARS-USMARC-190 TaxID=1263832 RepID=W0RAX5_BIBTR|nr:MacB family efflux pump subunit [Bibersteinia trehalosi]AHG86543.1 Macrolide export ATP-binding/permease protein MacB [Bibersteinia trehalosi USDA-ARS-USMARC-190]TCT17700.1 macrolide transport system ATP-binding/permease protein [Bibersteinia trehalosi]
MTKLIEISALNKYVGSAENPAHILKNINLTIEQGDFVAIIGASGSGKSTLMNILGCLDTASSGSYKIEGVETQRLSSNQLSDLRQRKFGFIFQRYNLLSSLNAVENVALPAIYAGLENNARLKRGKELLDKLGLGDKAQHRPNQLSGGQQQRVSIARALMNGGEIILADEPTGALDSKSGETVMEILQALHQEGHTLILVTHDPQIATHAERIIEIKDGAIIRDERQKVLSGKREDHKRPAKKPRFIDQLIESFNMAVSAILAHKMRALLTMLGIIIGITSVISVVALGKGSQEQILSNINNLGTNTMSVYNGTGFGDRRANLTRNLTISDVSALARQNYVESATPTSSHSGTIVSGNVAVSGQISGVGEQYFDVQGITLKSGRFFSAEEVVQSAQVVVIDSNTKNSLPFENPLGEIVLVDKKPLQIIGVADNEMRQSSNLSLWTPYTTLMQRISGAKQIDSITVKIKDNVESQTAEKSLTELLTARHGKKDFFVMNTDTIKQTIEATTGTMTLLISSIALISLVVGGIGVMNIMLVSVTERTKEIGVRMAIGAKQGNILQQFLIEAILICLLGGIIGILLAAMIIVGFNYWGSDFKMILSPESVVVAVVCSTLIGVIFGYIPARNASRLNPITALAQE